MNKPVDIPHDAVAHIRSFHSELTGQRTDSGKSVGLRADMDALPMTEDNEFAHTSTAHGRMHGCGHDGHTTMLLGAARHLVKTRKFNGTAYLIFQPGEEGYAGARAMMEDGLFDKYPADEVYALHNWPGLPAGKIGLRPGPTMAARHGCSQSRSRQRGQLGRDERDSARGHDRRHRAYLQESHAGHDRAAAR